MGKLIAIEGIDGAGKGTQAQQLVQRLKAEGYQTALISFPRYTETRMGQQIGRFLDGQFGPLNQLHPVPISMLYATERYESKAHLIKLLDSHDVVIADRYVGSNLAHQGSRLPDNEQSEFIEFLEELEFQIFGLPRPLQVILLDLTADVSAELVTRKQARAYTDQTADLQEADSDYLTSVREMYRRIADHRAEWSIIPCLNQKEELKSIEDIHQEIWDCILSSLGSNAP